MTIPGSAARSAYMKRKCIFAAMGNNVVIQSRKVPLYPQLIKFHNNIKLASSVSFINHDIAHSMINEMENISIAGKRVNEKIGCIEIFDNVFIGSGTRIMYNVRIGPNVIIGAGSVVTKDIPPNSVVAGVSAKVIGDFDSYLQKRINEKTYDISWHPQHQKISKKMIDWVWNEFETKQKIFSSEGDLQK